MSWPAGRHLLAREEETISGCSRPIPLVRRCGIRPMGEGEMMPAFR